MKISKLLQSIVWISMVYYGGVLSSCSNSNKEVLNTSGKLPDKIDFNFHVKPVLSDRCFACHGPDANAREADLRLDQEEAAYAALKETPGAHAIVPGKPGESMVYLRITSEDPDLMMPPPTSNLQLSEYEVRLIEKDRKSTRLNSSH